MGGRGASLSKGAVSADGVILKGASKHVERVTGMAKYGVQDLVLEATTDGKGNVTLQYASATGYREQNSRTSYAQYDLKAGITNLRENGNPDDLTSVNINWDKVKTVSGKTFGTQRLMREKGFKWDGAHKIWTR